MNYVLCDLVNKTCFVYLDKIILSTSLEKHIDNIQKVFQKLHEVNLKIQPDKCEFLQKETAYLRHIIRTDGVKLNPGKIKAI